MSRSSVLLIAGGALLVLYLGAVFGLPEPPEVSPSADVPANSAPPLSPGWAHTVVRIRPVTVPCG